MTRLTAKDFPQELLDYYDYYAHGKINKREFLNLAARYAVGVSRRWRCLICSSRITPLRNR